MKEIIDTVSANPVLLVIIVVALAVIAYSILKKLFKLAAIVLIAILIFFGYIYLTHEEPEQEIQKYIEQGTEVLDSAKDKAEEVTDDLKEKLEEYKK